ncbi:hypothetical protein [Legionella yabuuchiae]|uniref:hypothetical protein n=1 Tax=Legionella yabuuchiae TaxID=376727 RepID=UPI001055EC81|nr:hypothetical protein [Legionella yabuuchiae]
MENRRFDHERLDVYQEVIAFVMLSDEILEALPRGRAYLEAQLQLIVHGHVLAQWFFVRYEGGKYICIFYSFYVY